MTLPGKILLWLPSVIYRLAVALRNSAYDLGLLKSHSFTLPVICVGNITAGGTGKTPHVMYLAERLSEKMHVAVLSRGYLRRSRGFRAVSATDSVSSSGDEPLLMARRLTGAGVFVDRDRVNGIREIMLAHPSTGVVILDDGLQHRAVRAGMNILLTGYDNLITKDHLLPLGRLRESPPAMKRADIIIITKVPPGTTSEEMTRTEKELGVSTGQNIYFTTIAYEQPVSLTDGSKREITDRTEVLLVTGIADPAPLIRYISGTTAGVEHIAFPDHHRFTENDLKKITSAFDSITGDDKMIITTEKDGVRLKEIVNIADQVSKAFYYIPIRVEFVDNEEEFLNKVYRYAGESKKYG
jgi:tetraacyldisaccharide 4'-kinase